MRRLRLALWLLPLALALWAFVIEPQRLVVHPYTITLPGMSIALRGVHIAALSDLHVGGLHMSLGRLDRLVARTNALDADVIVLLGDFVSGHEGGEVTPERIATGLQPLRARLGVYAVLGNHDWWGDGPRMARALEAVGIRVLDDRALEIGPPGSGVWLAGIPDYTTRHGDPAALLARAQIPAGAPLVFLTHDPTVFPDVPARASLTLAGHTHGGQVRLPFVGAPVVPSRYGQRYARGHVVEGARQLFVTTGVGTSILPLRFGVAPEIALLTID